MKSVEHEGWRLKDRPGTNQWHMLYEGPDRKFDVYLCLHPAWVYFQVPLAHKARGSASARETPAHEAVLHHYLLHLNELAYWAKFGLDDEGTILLMLDMPTEVFDLDRLRWATWTLGAYATRLSYEVQIVADLAKDKHLGDLLCASKGWGEETFTNIGRGAGRGARA